MSRWSNRPQYRPQYPQPISPRYVTRSSATMRPCDHAATQHARIGAWACSGGAWLALRRLWVCAWASGEASVRASVWLGCVSGRRACVCKAEGSGCASEKVQPTCDGAADGRAALPPAILKILQFQLITWRSLTHHINEVRILNSHHKKRCSDLGVVRHDALT
jgi:hypothetical protein